MKKYKFSFFLLLIIGSVFLLSGCDLVVFHPQGMIAAKEVRLIIISTVLMLIIVVPVILMIFIIAWRYRASNTKATYTPNWAHSVKLEILWWTLPCIIVVIIAVITWFTSHELDPYKPLDMKEKPVTIQAISLDWRWLFIYPDQHIATINYVAIPAHTPIDFEITSQGPMNSLLIPQLAGQIYAMAGMRTEIHLIADQEGVYDGLSSNFSGDGFSNMKFKVHVGSQADFDKWVGTVKASSNNLDMQVYSELAKPSEDDSVVYYSAVEDNMFKKIIMQFDAPDMQRMQAMDK